MTAARYLSAALVAVGCTAGSRPAAEQPRAIASGATPAADAGAPRPAFAPAFDEEMACRRQHCYPRAVAHCFDTCYKYNHLRSPEAHQACNEGCRQSHDVVACEEACGRDRRAYTPLEALATCRKGCDGDRPNSCELRCLYALEESEASR